MALAKVDFFSNSLQRTVNFNILLPDDLTTCKALYLLHGYCGSNMDWLINSPVSELSSKYNLAVILPSGENSFYLDAKGTGKAFSQYIGVELVDYTRNVFGLSSSRDDTFIGGLSMGGFGALLNALKYPDTFGKVFALSSALIVHTISNMKEDTPCPHKMADYDYYHSVFGDLSKLESSANNPEYLAEELVKAGKTLPQIYMSCGTEDFLINENRMFKAFLDAHGIPVTYVEGTGVHDWHYWSKALEPSIQWLLNDPIKKQCVNPYLPSWEYIPDAEPYVFNGRVYVYGSHDRFNGQVFCLNDYACWSAPVDDLGAWRYEGIIYKKTDDPLNPDGRMCLYAPDVTVGPDGRYYLYYVLDKVSVVSVAVCDSPAGKYEFYGYVHYADGTRLGEREGDEPQFDPGVLTEGTTTYLYTGFCSAGDKTRTGAMATVLGPDMLTITEEPVFIAPGSCYGKGTSFEGHEYFEAASIRKYKDTYYFIYSSVAMNELCYATSKYPTKGFRYGGIIVSNCDSDKRTYPGGNNHGSIVEIMGDWYVFYHRQTNGTWFSRQGCMERIAINADGTIRQVEMTSLGGSKCPFTGHGEYPAYIACNLFRCDGSQEQLPKITQDGRDGDKEQGYVASITDSVTVGFKYFDCVGVQTVKIKVRGYCDGFFEVRTSLNTKPLGSIPVEFTNVWTEFSADIAIPNGVNALYFTYVGNGVASLASFSLA
ncbi:S-formylglutathione hydrolase FrmB [Acetanaerobacterium elongatum]|uniref:S-formylglutathione hydrolase FrmB n=1 Tax=Acetanaerobacterium elongatum TaxID=258515 RepID=A0A1H0A5V7_9FIRM|nr:S-formylglutathione hydrolase FrmB [Acetanaerobacterium elongatum]